MNHVMFVDSISQALPMLWLRSMKKAVRTNKQKFEVIITNDRSAMQKVKIEVK